MGFELIVEVDKPTRTCTTVLDDYTGGMTELIVRTLSEEKEVK